MVLLVCIHLGLALAGDHTPSSMRVQSFFDDQPVIPKITVAPDGTLYHKYKPLKPLRLHLPGLTEAKMKTNTILTLMMHNSTHTRVKCKDSIFCKRHNGYKFEFYDDLNTCHTRTPWATVRMKNVGTLWLELSPWKRSANMTHTAKAFRVPSVPYCVKLRNDPEDKFSPTAPKAPHVNITEKDNAKGRSLDRQSNTEKPQKPAI